MASVWTSTITRSTRCLATTWSSPFTPTPASLLPRVIVPKDLEVFRKGLVTSVVQDRKTVATGGRDQRNRHSKPHNTSTPAFADRIKFLGGSELSQLSPSSSCTTSQEQQRQQDSVENSSKDDDSSSTTPSSNSIFRRWTRAKRRYRPGYRPGDFVCPQCGSHNFRPPERTLAAIMETKALVAQYRRTQGSPLASASTIALDLASDSTAGGDNHQRSGASQETTHDHASDTQTSSSAQGSMIRSWHRKEYLPKRKFPIGATCQCFECGFETGYETLPTSAVTLQSVSTTTSTTQNTATEATIALRSDIRLAKPRDYTCPLCQSVNFNNRLFCVGCGVLAPWIKERVERGKPGLGSRTGRRIGAQGNGRVRANVISRK